MTGQLFSYSIILDPLVSGGRISIASLALDTRKGAGTDAHSDAGTAHHNERLDTMHPHYHKMMVVAPRMREALKDNRYAELVKAYSRSCDVDVEKILDEIGDNEEAVFEWDDKMYKLSIKYRKLDNLLDRFKKVCVLLIVSFAFYIIAKVFLVSKSYISGGFEFEWIVFAAFAVGALLVLVPLKICVFLIDINTRKYHGMTADFIELIAQVDDCHVVVEKAMELLRDIPQDDPRSAKELMLASMYETAYWIALEDVRRTYLGLCKHPDRVLEERKRGFKQQVMFIWDNFGYGYTDMGLWFGPATEKAKNTLKDQWREADLMYYI